MVYCQTAILLGYLVQTVTICSSSSSDKPSGDSNAIFIRYERLASPSWFLRRDLTIFIWGKEHSTEAVPTGMVRQTLARMLKFGNMVCIMELVDNSFNCSLISSLGWLVIIAKRFSTLWVGLNLKWWLLTLEIHPLQLFQLEAQTHSVQGVL